MRSKQAGLYRKGQGVYHSLRHIVFCGSVGGFHIRVRYVRLLRAAVFHAGGLRFGCVSVFKKFPRNCCIFRVQNVINNAA